MEALIEDLKQMNKRPVFYRPQAKVASLLKKMADSSVKIADDGNVLKEIVTGLSKMRFFSNLSQLIFSI